MYTIISRVITYATIKDIKSLSMVRGWALAKGKIPINWKILFDRHSNLISCDNCPSYNTIFTQTIN